MGDGGARASLGGGAACGHAGEKLGEHWQNYARGQRALGEQPLTHKKLRAWCVCETKLLRCVGCKSLDGPILLRFSGYPSSTRVHSVCQPTTRNAERVAIRHETTNRTHS